MTNDVFNNNNNTPPTTTTNQQTTGSPEGTTDPFAVENSTTVVPPVTTVDGTSQWIGEGKKYASMLDMDKGMVNANSHISKLEAENAALKESKAMDGKLDQILSNMSTPQNSNSTQATPQKTPVADVSAVDINSAIEAKFNQQRVKDNEDANQRTFSDVVIKQFGSDKVGEMVAQKASELGMTVLQLQTLARTNPKAALAFFAQTQAPVNTTNFNHNTQSSSITPQPLVGNGDFLTQAQVMSQFKIHGDKGQLNLNSQSERNAMLATEAGKALKLGRLNEFKGLS